MNKLQIIQKKLTKLETYTAFVGMNMASKDHVDFVLHKP